MRPVSRLSSTWCNHWQRQPVVADLTINGLVLDLRAIDWLAFEQNPNPKQSRQGRVVKQLDDLLPRQLDDFTLKTQRFCIALCRRSAPTRY